MNKEDEYREAIQHAQDRLEISRTIKPHPTKVGWWEVEHPHDGEVVEIENTLIAFMMDLEGKWLRGQQGRWRSPI